MIKLAVSKVLKLKSVQPLSRNLTHQLVATLQEEICDAKNSPAEGDVNSAAATGSTVKPTNTCVTYTIKIEMFTSVMKVH